MAIKNSMKIPVFAIFNAFITKLYKELLKKHKINLYIILYFEKQTINTVSVFFLNKIESFKKKVNIRE